MSREIAWAAVTQAPQVALSTVSGRTDPWSRWAEAVVTLALGDYRGAFDALHPLCERDDEVGGLACARIASGLRQIDEHEAAVDWDERAIAAGGRATNDGLVGRAADAVGMSDPDLAASYLGAGRERAVDLRDEIRVAWVAEEICLLKGQYPLALAHGERAHRLSLALGSPRHIVKSALFASAAGRATGAAGTVALLGVAFSRAQALALRPMLWPIVTVLADDATPAQRVAAGQAVRYLHDHLPPGFGSAWTGRSDIGTLRHTA